MITQSMNADLFHRIMAKVEITDGCWLWRGGMHNGVSPMLSMTGNVKINVRRVLYEHHIGEPPRNIRMACGQRRCVNPAHVSKPKTQAQRGCQTDYDRKKRAQGEKPIARLRRLAKRCGFELRRVGKKRYRVWPML